MKSLCLFIALFIAAIATAARAHGDCVDRLIGRWELDIDRAAIGRSDKLRKALTEYYGGNPFMRFTFTATSITYSQYDRETWSEPQVWQYQVADESQDSCEILITSESEGAWYSTPMRLEFDSMGFCHHADGEVESVDCYVSTEDGLD